MLTIDPQTTSALDMYQFLIGAVSPRPIAFVSSVDTEGVANLAPFSFFNAFSGNPPIIGFSSALRGSDGTRKDTLENVTATGECVVNIVTHRIVRQMALTSQRFPKDVSEFDKAGFTPLPSDLVRAPRVAESPIQMECRVEQIIPLGTEGGAGNLVICRVVRMHISEAVLDLEKNRIDPRKLDAVGRNGRYWYTRANGNALFEIQQPELPLGVGFDALPPTVRKSDILTGNSLATMAAMPELPSKDAILQVKKDVRVQKMLFSGNILRGLHWLAQEEFAAGNVDFATKVALLGEFE